MADGAHEQLEVAATPARCFAVATDYEAYPSWTSDVKQATVLARDGRGRGAQVEFHVAGLGRRVRYVVEYDYAEAPAAFSWKLVEGDLLRALEGRYAFTATDDGTLVDYTLHLELAVPMPGLVRRRASGMIMANALRDLQRAVEHATTDEEPTPPMTWTPPPDDDTPEPPAIPQVPDVPDAAASACVAHHPDAVPFDEVGVEPRPLPPPSILECVIGELLGAVPEVKDHVLEAADALLDAAKALIDAADRVVRQQRGEG
jgi:ribosome-associated toxin RatA of RatAB toxin-antitoxin module